MEYFGLTDKGRVRPTNQDIFQIEARRTTGPRSSLCATAWAVQMRAT